MSSIATAKPDGIRPGVGLSAMRERAREIGGECTISRAGSGGTSVRAELPLETL